MKKLRHNQIAEEGADGYTTITGECIVTGKPHTIRVSTEGLNRWLGGDYIQNALKSATSDEREFLISGCSPEGWDKLFHE